jgi:hypothetical protein
MTHFLQPTLDSPAVTVEQLREIRDTAMPKFERLGSGEETTLTFVQSAEGEPHRLLDMLWIVGNHRSFLPGAEKPCPHSPDYQPNRVP